MFSSQTRSCALWLSKSCRASSGRQLQSTSKTYQIRAFSLVPPLSLSMPAAIPASCPSMLLSDSFGSVMPLGLKLQMSTELMKFQIRTTATSIMQHILDMSVWFIKRTFQPSIIRKKRKQGFLERQKSVGGRRVLKRRIKKGRARLA